MIGFISKVTTVIITYNFNPTKVLLTLLTKKPHTKKPLSRPTL